MLLENATVRRYGHLQGERNTLKQSELFSAISKRVKTWIDSVLIRCQIVLKKSQFTDYQSLNYWFLEFCNLAKGLTKSEERNWPGQRTFVF